jgi:hypothetical protein
MIYPPTITATALHTDESLLSLHIAWPWYPPTADAKPSQFSLRSNFHEPEKSTGCGFAIFVYFRRMAAGDCPGGLLSIKRSWADSVTGACDLSRPPPPAYTPSSNPMASSGWSGVAGWLMSLHGCSLSMPGGPNRREVHGPIKLFYLLDMNGHSFLG